MSPLEGTGPAYRKEKLTTFLGSLLCQQCFLKSILNCSCCSLSCFHFSYALPLEGDNCEQLEQASEGAISLASWGQGRDPSLSSTSQRNSSPPAYRVAQDPGHACIFAHVPVAPPPQFSTSLSFTSGQRAQCPKCQGLVLGGRGAKLPKLGALMEPRPLPQGLFGILLSVENQN